MLNDDSARAAWSRNGLAFADNGPTSTACPQHAADVILAEARLNEVDAG